MRQEGVVRAGEPESSRERCWLLPSATMWQFKPEGATISSYLRMIVKRNQDVLSKTLQFDINLTHWGQIKLRRPQQSTGKYFISFYQSITGHSGMA